MCTHAAVPRGINPEGRESRKQNQWNNETNETSCAHMRANGMYGRICRKEKGVRYRMDGRENGMNGPANTCKCVTHDAVTLTINE